tara:strand:- start:429 stop:1337 length:909 start_codon:yes stop_codon:yes gene_type:complete
MLLFPILLFVVQISNAQKAKLFSTTDFDLTGKVKTCLLITDYGKEELNFNNDGILTKLVTRYNDLDYDITYYKFSNGKISEKRVENYRDGHFDKNTSIANIYVTDSTSTGIVITEKIVSYAKEFLDQYEYTYDKQGTLTAILRNYDDGIENTLLTYEEINGEKTTTYTLDGEIQKTIRVSERETKNSATLRIELTKDFIGGKPYKAVEQIFNQQDKLISENIFDFDEKTKSFISKELKTYTYNKLGMLTTLKIKKGKLESIKKYIYQYDDGEKGNWIKQIITPDNTYITRKISYYEQVISKE